jgi:hypothetical protein
MRNRKFLVGTVLAVTAMFATAAVAQAAITQTMTVSATNTKQNKKVAGGTGLHVDIKTNYPLGTPASQSASHTDLDLPKDYKFVPPAATCNPTSLTGTTTDQAKAACPGSQVGSGVAQLCNTVAGCAGTPGGGPVPATITAFNGIKSGGNPTLVLHTKPNGVAQANAPVILTGTLIPSPLGGVYGKRLSVEIQDTSSTNLDLVDFDTTITKLKTKKPNKAKHKPAQFYIMAKCTKKSWAFQETTTYRAGGGTASASATVPCKQKK